MPSRGAWRRLRARRGDAGTPKRPPLDVQRTGAALPLPSSGFLRGLYRQNGHAELILQPLEALKLTLVELAQLDLPI